MSAWIAGVDGCRGGWFAVLRNLANGELRGRVASTVREVIEARERPQVIAIGVPIGLPEQAEPGGRSCDRAARAALGDRRFCMFAPPARAALHAETFEQALRINRQSSAHNLGISRQSFLILPRIAEVDALFDGGFADARRLVEVHPELSFAELAGAPLRFPKYEAAGRVERRQMLERIWRLPLGEFVADVRRDHRRDVAVDDVLDAMAACWTAARVHAGNARAFGPEAGRDGQGRRMTILA